MQYESDAAHWAVHVSLILPPRYGVCMWGPQVLLDGDDPGGEVRDAARRCRGAHLQVRCRPHLYGGPRVSQGVLGQHTGGQSLVLSLQYAGDVRYWQNMH